MTALEWEMGWADRICRYCPHVLAVHPLYLVSSRELNHREAKCGSCDCTLRNFS